MLLNTSVISDELANVFNIIVFVLLITVIPAVVTLASIHNKKLDKAGTEPSSETENEIPEAAEETK